MPSPDGKHSAPEAPHTEPHEAALTLFSARRRSRAILVIVIIVEVIVIDLVDRLHAGATQRPLVVELLQASPRLVLDLTIQLGKLLGVSRSSAIRSARSSR